MSRNSTQDASSSGPSQRSPVTRNRFAPLAAIALATLRWTWGWCRQSPYATKSTGAAFFFSPQAASRRSRSVNPGAARILLDVLEEKVAGQQHIRRRDDRVVLIPRRILVLPQLAVFHDLHELLGHLPGPVVLLAVEGLQRVLSVDVQRAGHQQVVVIDAAEVVALHFLVDEARVRIQGVVLADPVHRGLHLGRILLETGIDIGLDPVVGHRAVAED